jgi:cytochrome c
MARIRYRLLPVLLAAAAIGAGALALRPEESVSTEGKMMALLQGASIDRETLAMFERSCQNCHSEKTEWPWYSRIPPASFLIQHDVKEARARMNLSRWGEYSVAEKRLLLSEIGGAVRSGTMPPARYRFLHPDSKLSPVERETIYQWTRRERLHVVNPAGNKIGAGSVITLEGHDERKPAL